MNNIITKGKGGIFGSIFLGSLQIASRALNYLVVFTSLVKLHAITRPTTKAVLSVLLNKYISEHGRVKRVSSRQANQFLNELWYLWIL